MDCCTYILLYIILIHLIIIPFFTFTLYRGSPIVQTLYVEGFHLKKKKIRICVATMADRDLVFCLKFSIKDELRCSLCSNEAELKNTA